MIVQHQLKRVVWNKGVDMNEPAQVPSGGLPSPQPNNATSNPNAHQQQHHRGPIGHNGHALREPSQN